MFPEEELKSLDGFKKGPDHVEVKCGCSSKKYGDFPGKLRVFSDGRFVIECECFSGCDGDKLSPYNFEKHSGRPGMRKWTSHIWVLKNEKKVPLWRTCLLKYYKHASNEGNGYDAKRIFHRDEFVSCFRCKKQRRFRLRTTKECRIYHDALASEKWKCGDPPFPKMSCEEEEERASRKSCRGCPRWGTCKGCTKCVCFGCLKCRFQDCSCRTCVDFMQNAEP